MGSSEEKRDDQNPLSLLELLFQPPILETLCPYVPIKSRLALQNVNKTYRSILQSAHETYRYVDLSRCSRAIVPSMQVDRGGINWRSQRMDEALTEDDVYCGPLRGIFSSLRRQHALAHIHTLVLDGLTVPADLIHEIVAETNVQLLSLARVKQLNNTKLRQVLEYACRPTRPEGTPRLKGLYLFGEGRDLNYLADRNDDEVFAKFAGTTLAGDSGSSNAQRPTGRRPPCPHKWYQAYGDSLVGPRWSQRDLEAWTQTISACYGIIAFDVVLCRGSRHSARALENHTFNGRWLGPQIAQVALGPEGCASCGHSRVKPAVWGDTSSVALPILHPLPTHSAAVSEAQKPLVPTGKDYPPLYVSCKTCLVGRHCRYCEKWWCETCYPPEMEEDHSNETENSTNAAAEYGNRTVKPKLLFGLCIDSCLITEEMDKSGGGGTWG